MDSLVGEPLTSTGCFLQSTEWYRTWMFQGIGPQWRNQPITCLTWGGRFWIPPWLEVMTFFTIENTLLQGTVPISIASGVCILVHFKCWRLALTDWLNSAINLSLPSGWKQLNFILIANAWYHPWWTDVYRKWYSRVWEHIPLRLRPFCSTSLI
jgi:hypothetical protein